MPGTYRFESEAQTEYFQGISYYAKEATEAVAARFVAEVEAAAAAICAAPGMWRVVKAPDIRRYVLRRFPFVFYYRYQPAENLVVLYALMHTSRRPGYWHERLTSPP